MADEIVTTPAPEAAAPITPAPETAPAPQAEPKADPAPAAEPVKEEPRKTEELKKEEAAKPAAPEKYELALSEGSKLSAARLTEIEAEAKELGLSNEAAQKLVAREEKAIADHVAAEAAAYQERQAKWVDEVKAHPTFGGDRANETMELAKRVVDKHGSEKFKEVLRTTELGNFPELVFFCASIAKANGMAEDKIVTSGVSANDRGLSAAQVLFPNTK